MPNSRSSRKYPSLCENTACAESIFLEKCSQARGVTVVQDCACVRCTWRSQMGGRAWRPPLCYLASRTAHISCPARMSDRRHCVLRPPASSRPSTAPCERSSSAAWALFARTCAADTWGGTDAGNRVRSGVRFPTFPCNRGRLVRCRLELRLARSTHRLQERRPPKVVLGGHVAPGVDEHGQHAQIA